MGSAEHDVADEVEQAWTRFRGRLADRIAGLVDDEVLSIEPETGVEEDALAGAAPYLQLVAWGDELVRAEVSSNAFLDERFRLSEEAGEQLLRLGWLAPDPVSANFHTDVAVREADRVAVMAVRTLREVFGCVHPAFLSADGLEVDPDARVWGPNGADEEDDEPVAEFPTSQDELRAMVDRALGVAFETPLRHDDDGDVPIVTGRSAIFVRVLEDAPAVELFAELVVEAGDPERALLEVGILNRNHPFARFYLRDDVIVMSYRIFAFPFAATQLRAALGVMMDGVDDLARDLAVRVDGRRFFDGVDEPVPDRDDPSPALLGLLELLHEGPVGPRLAAALFDGDRHDLIGQLVRLRTGVDLPGDHDLELVLGELRAALRFVADPEDGSKGRRTVPPRPARTRQLTLLPERDDTLDSGSWEHDLEGTS